MMSVYNECQNSALIIVHPHEEYDHGAHEEVIVDRVEQFEGDVIYVADSTENDTLRKGELESLYGYGLHDYLVMDEVSGGIDEETIIGITEEYDELFLGGGYAKQCMRNAHSSLMKNTETDFFVVPDISFDQQFRVTNGEEDTRRYTLRDAWGKTSFVEDTFEHFFGANEGTVKTAMPV